VAASATGRELRSLRSSAFSRRIVFANKDVEHLESKSVLIVKAYIGK
jgi:hypothetical protein